MFCKYCGKEIPDGSKICPECGKELQTTTNYSQIGDKPNSAVELANTAMAKVNAAPKRRVVLISFIVALISFIFPYISAEMEKLGESKSSGFPFLFSAGNFGDYGVSWWLWGTFLAVLIGGVAVFLRSTKKDEELGAKNQNVANILKKAQDNDTLIGMICGAVGAFFMLMFRITFKSKCNMKALEKLGFDVDVDIKIGFLIGFLALLSAAAFCYLGYVEEKKGKSPLKPIPTQNAANNNASSSDSSDSTNL